MTHFMRGYCYDTTIGASWWCFRELFQAKMAANLAKDSEFLTYQQLKVLLFSGRKIMQ